EVSGVKMRRSIFVFSLVAIIALIGNYVPAMTQSDRSQQQAPQRKDDQITIGTFEVRLPITVKRKNKFVLGLVEPNFEVYEDGKRQRIEKFIAPSQLPLNIAVLMDTSESVKLKLPFEKDAAEDFIATVTTYRRKDQVLFATFDSDVELHQDFTDAQEPLIRAIKKVKAGGYTRMYDAVYRIIEEKMANVEDKEARRIIVILSDGADTASERSLREAIEMAQAYDVTIFGISTKNFRGIQSGTVESADDKELRRLCEATGGQVFLPSEKAELFRSFSEVSDNLRKEYVIYYKPLVQEKNGKRREIKVKLVRGAEGDLFHKQGYKY
ncbi:MAG TPA: VWA domain-containing protein, partial [Blastocatellia bacterium]|nr:VWA domain-containing protein [Blastocatellia bacterium]